jgi:hypothetical protein
MKFLLSMLLCFAGQATEKIAENQQFCFTKLSRFGTDLGILSYFPAIFELLETRRIASRFQSTPSKSLTT